MAINKKNAAWAKVDFANPRVQAIIKNMLAKISSIQEQALADLASVHKEKRDLIAKISRRSDDDKIQAILKRIK